VDWVFYASCCVCAVDTDIMSQEQEDLGQPLGQFDQQQYGLAGKLGSCRGCFLVIIVLARQCDASPYCSLLVSCLIWTSRAELSVFFPTHCRLHLHIMSKTTHRSPYIPIAVAFLGETCFRTLKFPLLPKKGCLPPALLSETRLQVHLSPKNHQSVIICLSFTESIFLISAFH
jgi:hypothetical protein